MKLPGGNYVKVMESTGDDIVYTSKAEKEKKYVAN